VSGAAAILDVFAAVTIFAGTGNNGPVGLLPLILGAGPVVVWFVAVSIVLLRGAAPNGQKAVPSAAA
jgi:hypothetical protein